MRRLFLWLFLVAFLPFFVGAVKSDSFKVPMVAVMPFTGRSLDADASDGIAATLATDLLNTGKFRVMERSQMESILKEQGFQKSGACDGSECAVEVGKLLSVDHMVVGTVAKVGGPMW
jgi:curli biogenesis system outer membrane secretion channel CsgG